MLGYMMLQDGGDFIDTKMSCWVSCCTAMTNTHTHTYIKDDKHTVCTHSGVHKHSKPNVDCTTVQMGKYCAQRRLSSAHHFQSCRTRCCLSSLECDRCRSRWALCSGLEEVPRAPGKHCGPKAPVNKERDEERR